MSESKIENCNDKEGTAVIKIHVHVDPPAILLIASAAMAAKQKPMSSFTGVSVWFGDIFDELNKELMPYGVQFHGIFTDISTSNLLYDRTKCIEGNPPAVRAQLATTSYMASAVKDNGRIGNRLVVFFCPNNYSSQLVGKVRQGNCENVMGFLFGPIPTLRKTIKETIIQQIFRTEETSGDDYNKAVCKINDNCVDKEDSVIGQYIRDLKSVRHSSSEKYILKDKERLNEHDLYDDIYIQDYKDKSYFDQ